MAKTLYICYFGLREPLVQTQVLPYLREIIKDGVRVELLTLEPARKGGKNVKRQVREREFEAVRKELSAEGIEWHWLTYHKRFSVLATAYDICRGAIYIWNRLRKEEIDVLHGRVHIPTLMGALARKLSRRKPKLLFDIRGFFPEEYTDAGRWPENGWLFRSAKRVEKWLLKEADGFVVLTEKAREILFPESAESGRDKLGRPVEVIPCCVDLERFGRQGEQGRRESRDRLGVSGRRVIAYVGSFGGWYLTDEMMEFFATAREFDRSVFALILTQRDTENIVERLRSRGFSDDDLLVESVAPDDIADYLGASDVAISFIKSCYSKLSSSPTKIAEYLACGVPIITNRGVGDVAEIIESHGVGVVIDSFDKDSYLKALSRVEHMVDIYEKCTAAARAEFELETVGGQRYRRIYSQLLS